MTPMSVPGCMATLGHRSNAALAAVFTLLVLLFSLSRQVVTQGTSSAIVGTLVAAVLTFFATIAAVRWARAPG